jgi:hypothetical protein
MKHSAKAVAKLAREREKLARRSGQPGGAGAVPADEASRAAQPGPAGAAAAVTEEGRVASVPPPASARSAASIAGAASAPFAAASVADPSLANDTDLPTQAPAPARSATATTVSKGAARHRLAQLPYALVLAGMVLGLALMQGGVQAVRGGTLVIAGALLAGSLTRLVLPEGRAGLLGSRRRLVDVAVLTALGVGLLVAGLIVKVPS